MSSGSGLRNGAQTPVALPMIEIIIDQYTRAVVRPTGSRAGRSGRESRFSAGPFTSGVHSSIKTRLIPLH